jgi:hypothetical protein
LGGTLSPFMRVAGRDVKETPCQRRNLLWRDWSYVWNLSYSLDF